MSELVKALIANLGLIKEIILYFSTGYFFLQSYSITTKTPREDVSDHLIIKCITFSCVFSVINDIITSSSLLPDKYKTFQMAIIIVIAMVSGLILGMIRRCRLVSNIIDRIIGGNLNEDLRIDIAEELNGKSIKGIRIHTKTEKEVYQGQIRRICGSSTNPVFMINNCEKVKYDGDEEIVLKQYGHEDLMLFSYSDLDSVELFELNDKA